MLHVTTHCDHCAICTEKIFKVHLGEWAIMCIWQYFGNPFTVLPRLAPSQEWQDWGERHHILHNWQRNHSSCPGDIGVDGVEGNAWRCSDLSQFISRFYTRWYRFACHWLKYPYLTKQFTESWTHHRDLTKRVTLDSIMEWRKTCVQNLDSILRRGHIYMFILLLVFVVVDVVVDTRGSGWRQNMCSCSFSLVSLTLLFTQGWVGLKSKSDF